MAWVLSMLNRVEGRFMHYHIKCENARQFLHPSRTCITEWKCCQRTDDLMFIYVTLPAILALVGFKSPVPVHVFIERLLPSKSFSTFVTHERPFTCVYPFMTFHVTYSCTKHKTKEISLWLANRFNNFSTYICLWLSICVEISLMWELGKCRNFRFLPLKKLMKFHEWE